MQILGYINMKIFCLSLEKRDRKQKRIAKYEKKKTFLELDTN